MGSSSDDLLHRHQREAEDIGERENNARGEKTLVVIRDLSFDGPFL